MGDVDVTDVNPATSNVVNPATSKIVEIPSHSKVVKTSASKVVNSSKASKSLNQNAKCSLKPSKKSSKDDKKGRKRSQNEETLSELKAARNEEGKKSETKVDDESKEGGGDGFDSSPSKRFKNEENSGTVPERFSVRNFYQMIVKRKQRSYTLN